MAKFADFIELPEPFAFSIFDMSKSTPDTAFSGQYDLILAGAGLAGLTLAVELAKRPYFQKKKILLIDRDDKRRNDRTWCCWATDEEYLPPVVFKSWNFCQFNAPGFEKKMSIAPYRYRMVRGIDFYNWAFDELAKHPNIERKLATITRIDAAAGLVQTDRGDFTAGYILNSAFLRADILPSETKTYLAKLFSPDTKIANRNFHSANQNPNNLLQHFKGWLIETAPGTFDPAAMTFMDFRIEQEGETRFVYVLPLSDSRALVEFTVFSPALLQEADYVHALKNYLVRFLKIQNYRILEEEFGVIPMTDVQFPSRQEGRLIHIGTAGGFVKASSGYAFKRTQQKIRAFVDAWEQSGVPDPGVLRSSSLFRGFDNIFLQVLKNKNEIGGEIFARLFRQLPPDLVLRFLDEDTTFAENLRVISAPPMMPFLHAFFQQAPRLLRQ